MIDFSTFLAFLAITACATYIQTVTGFALGMIVMGSVTALDLVPITFTSIVISIVTFVNGVVAVRGHTRALDLKRIALVCTGLIPAIPFGLWLLEFMSGEFNAQLQILLGATIIVAGLMIMAKPTPLTTPSSGLLFSASGAAGGLMAGMFSMSGPPLIYLFYRQPLDIQTIRLCLVTVFLLSHASRTLIVGTQDGINSDVLIFSALCIPATIFFTWLGKTYPPSLSANNLRRVAFLLLILIGVSLVLKNLLPL